MPEQLKSFRIQDALSSCCANEHLNPETMEEIGCDRQLVFSALSSWFGRDGKADSHLEEFNQMVRDRLAPIILQTVGGDALPLKYTWYMVGICEVPFLSPVLTKIAHPPENMSGYLAVIWAMRLLSEVFFLSLLGIFATRLNLKLCKLGQRWTPYVSKICLSIVLSQVAILAVTIFWTGFASCVRNTAEDNLLPILPVSLLIACLCALFCSQGSPRGAHVAHVEAYGEGTQRMGKCVRPQVLARTLGGATLGLPGAEELLQQLGDYSAKVANLEKTSPLERQRTLVALSRLASALDRRSPRLFEALEAAGVVTRVHFQAPAEKCWSIWKSNMQQTLMMNDCLYRAKGHTKWLFPSLDVDEYLNLRVVPDASQQSQNIASFLDEQVEKYMPGQKVKAISFTKFRFARASPGFLEISSMHRAFEPESEWSKYAVQTSSVQEVGIHQVLWGEGTNVSVSVQEGSVNHYRHPNLPETKRKEFAHVLDELLLGQVSQVEDALQQRFGSEWRGVLDNASKAEEPALLSQSTLVAFLRRSSPRALPRSFLSYLQLAATTCDDAGRLRNVVNAQLKELLWIGADGRALLWTLPAEELASLVGSLAKLLGDPESLAPRSRARLRRGLRSLQCDQTGAALPRGWQRPLEASSGGPPSASDLRTCGRPVERHVGTGGRTGPRLGRCFVREVWAGG
eukprot:g28499.t1